MITHINPGDVFFDDKNVGKNGDGSLYFVISSMRRRVTKDSNIAKAGNVYMWDATVLCTPEKKVIGTVIWDHDAQVKFVSRA